MNKKRKHLINFTVSLLFFLSIQGAFSMQAEPVKYVVDFESYKTKCVIYVNGTKALSNGNRKGPVMAGLTMSAFLENGSNTVAFDMAPVSNPEVNNKYEPDARCGLSVSKIILHETSEEEIELFKLSGNVDKGLKPTAKTTPNYQNNQVMEKQVAGTDFYRVSKSFEISGLPEWTWTKAKPFEPTKENMEKLRQAYLDVWQSINSKNEQQFIELSKISFSEDEIAAHYPGSWYKSLDLDKYLERSSGAVPINWDKYKLIILNKGRLVKLEDNEGYSPLGFKNENGGLITSYNPYFSLIDGKMIITR